MSTLPTSRERTDTALTLARTRAAAFADTGNMEMAYQSLLRGVRSAQRVVKGSQTGASLAGLWATPAVKASVLGAAAAVTAAATRAKSKPKIKTRATTKKSRARKDKAGKAKSTSGPSTRQHRSRLRRRRGKDTGVTGSTARDIMSEHTECAAVSDSLADAACRMRDLDVGALPICGDNHRLQGMITDRDIVVKCIAEGRDPATTQVSEFAEGKPVTIGADDSVQEALRTMAQHGVRRLPVLDGQQLVGIVSQADVAKNLPDDAVGDLIEAISTAPANG